jgi:hypothetical protein
MMAKVKTESPKPTPKRRTAMTPEGREGQMVALAVDLAERQLREGTASSQVITHFLKLGSERERLERERLAEENKLLRAKTEALEAQKESKVQYEKILKALRNYNGMGDPDEYDY